MFQQFLTGVLIGCLYAVVAQAFVIAYIATRTFNFAIAQLLTLAAFVGVALGSTGWLGTPGRLIVIAAVGALAGAVVYLVAVAPFSGATAHDVRWLLTSVAISLVLEDLITNSQGTETRPLGFGYVDGTSNFFGARLSNQLLLIAGVSVLMICLLYLLIQRTPLGLQMRAVAESKETAELVGVNSRLFGILSYAVGMIGATIGAVLWASQAGVSPKLGQPLLIASFGAAIIGGLTSLRGGVLVGGIIYGVATQTAGYAFGSAAGSIVGLVIVIAVLVVRPDGLFGKRLQEKV